MTWWEELIIAAGLLILWVLLMIGYGRLEVRWDRRRAQGAERKQARIAAGQAAKSE